MYNYENENLQSVIKQLQQEINEHKGTEEKLRRANEQVNHILESISDCFFALDKNWKFTYVNNEAERLWGIKKEDLLGEIIWEKFPRLNQTIFYINCHQVLQEQAALHFETFSLIVQKWLMVHIYSLKDGLSIYFRDITEQKTAEETLEIERKRLNYLIDSIPAIIYLMTDDYKIKYANRKFIESFGEPGSKTCYEVINHYRQPCQNCPTNKIFNNKTSLQWEQEDCRGRILEIYDTFFIDVDNRPLSLKVLFDITNRKQTEQEIARLDRLNLIGQMAAGLGHEIRNPMTTVRGFLQMLGAKKECQSYTDYFNLMINELDRANSIITEYLSVAKNNNNKLTMQNLNHIITIMSPLISADASEGGKNLKIELTQIPDLPLDEKGIRQLVLNLVRNALEAMSSSGGTVTIKTFDNNKNIILAVQDEGSGITQEQLEKIGTPFFTTKNNGTGLGLAVCYGIAVRHHAVINIETGPTGTTFYVLFNRPKPNLLPND